MLNKNAKKILESLDIKDSVLDIGGWASPFNRANYVVDIYPYETRGGQGSQGGNKEFFTKNTWINHDVSSKKSLPFKDNQFDFVICSHILEDVRDPVFLCSEIMRVGKRGYFEVPSEIVELTRGVANNSYCGYYHHRWLVRIENNSLKFRFKPHFIHNNWKYHFPKSFLKKLKDEERVSYLFWEKKFDYYEVIQVSRDKTQDYVYEFVKSKRVYPPIYYSFDSFLEKISNKLTNLRLKIYPRAYKHKYMDTPEVISK
jgi:hypothetical protein